MNNVTAESRCVLRIDFFFSLLVLLSGLGKTHNILKKMSAVKFTLVLCLQVTSRRLWKMVYNELGGSPGSTSAATCTRRHYEK